MCKEIKRNRLKEFFIFTGLFLGSILGTQYLSLYFDPIISSCLIGLLGSVLHKVITRKTVFLFLYNSHFDKIVYSGSFLGMVQGPPSFDTYRIVEYILLALVAAIVYSKMLLYAKGYGGKLGTIAFITGLTSLIIGYF